MSQQSDWSKYYDLRIEQQRTKQLTERVCVTIIFNFLQAFTLMGLAVLLFTSKLSILSFILCLFITLLPQTINQIAISILKWRIYETEIKKENVSEAREENS